MYAVAAAQLLRQWRVLKRNGRGPWKCGLKLVCAGRAGCKKRPVAVASHVKRRRHVLVSWVCPLDSCCYGGSLSLREKLCARMPRADPHTPSMRGALRTLRPDVSCPSPSVDGDRAQVHIHSAREGRSAP